MVTLDDLRHDIKWALGTFAPSCSTHESRRQKRAKKYLKKIEVTFNKTINENNMPKFPFRHVLKDMGIKMDYDNPEWYLLQARKKFSDLNF